MSHWGNSKLFLRGKINLKSVFRPFTLMWAAVCCNHYHRLTLYCVVWWAQRKIFTSIIFIISSILCFLHYFTSRSVGYKLFFCLCITLYSLWFGSWCCTFQCLVPLLGILNFLRLKTHELKLSISECEVLNVGTLYSKFLCTDGERDIKLLTLLLSINPSFLFVTNIFFHISSWPSESIWWQDTLIVLL